MNTTKFVAALFIMAAVTYIIRLIPLTFFRRKITNKYIKAFLEYVPYAVLGAMTIPDVFSSTGSTLSAIIGTITAFILAYFGKGLLTVSLSACAVAYITDLITTFI